MASDAWDDQRQLCDVWFQPGLTEGDRDWIRAQWKAIDVAPPSVDIRWLRLDYGGSRALERLIEQGE